MVSADKAANNIAVVLRLHYIDTLKQERKSIKTYEQTSEKEKSVINNHIFHNVTRFAVSDNDDQVRLPTFYWLPKLHKQQYKAQSIANSGSCTTTECYPKKHVIKNMVKKSMKGPVKNFWVNQKIHVRH